MKFNIYINQYKLSENQEITIQDCAVIDWLYSMFGSTNSKIIKSKEEGWNWVSLTHLIEDMPLLRIKTNSGASKLIKRIEKLGFIETRVDRKERKLYAKPTKKLQGLYFSNVKKDQVRKDLSQVPQETSQVLEDTNHNTNINTLDTIQGGSAEVVVKKEEKAPYSFIVEFNKMGDSRWLPDKIIYNYWRKKGFTFDNLKQFQAARSRNIRAAKALEGYTSKQINETMDYCEEKFKDMGWTLETCGKRIAEVINKKK